MKTIGAFLTVLMMLGTLVVAADPPRQAKAVGEIVSIDAAGKTVVVKIEGQGSSENAIFVVPDGAKVVKEGKAAKFGDLAEGDRVTVSYRAEGGKNVAISIDIGSKE